MQTKRKNAPFLKDQPQNKPFNDIIILAGAKSWEAYGKDGKGEEWELIRQALNQGAQKTDGEIISHKQKPIILGERELKQLDRLQLLPQGHKTARFYQIGALTEAQKTAICVNLANHSQAQTVALFASIDDNLRLLENWSGYLTKLRNDEEQSALAQKIAQTATTPPRLDLNTDKPTQKEIAEAFLKWHKNPLARDIGRAKTLEYNGKFWQEKSDEEIRRLIMAFYDEHNGDYTAKKLSSIRDLVELKAQAIPEQNTDFIGFQNGVLNKKTGTFSAHNIEYYLRGIEKFACNTDTRDTPLFDDWIDFVSNGNEEKKGAILAAFYMILTNRHEWGLFLEATGTAGAGKSVFAQIAQVINGSNNTTTLPLESLEDPRATARAVLLDKSFAYSPDQSPYSGYADTLKAVTGGDEIAVKILYENERAVKLNFIYMLVTNHLMAFKDRNGAILRRRVIFTFDRAIPAEKKDVYFVEKVQKEVYGIVNKLLALFPKEERARQILEDYRDRQEANQMRHRASHLSEFCSHFEIRDCSRSHALKMGSAKDKNLDVELCQTLYSTYIFYCECQAINQAKRLDVRQFRDVLPDVFKQNGNKIDFDVKRCNDGMRTNAFWKDRESTLAEWKG